MNVGLLQFVLAGGMGLLLLAVEDVLDNGYDDVVIQNNTTQQIVYANMNGGTFQGWVGIGSVPGYTGHTGPATASAETVHQSGSWRYAFSVGTSGPLVLALGQAGRLSLRWD